MNSTREVALSRVANAIEELDAHRRDVDPADLTDRVAAVWALMAAIDPQLAKITARYTSE